MDKNEPKKPDKPHLFQPGHVANPNGRPKGSLNKLNSQMREIMYEFFEGNIDTMQSDFDAMEPKDRMAFRAKMFQFYMPTMTASKIEKTINHTGYEHMTTEKLTQLILTINQPSDIEHIDVDENERD
jgi:hypothetical protein